MELKHLGYDNVFFDLDTETGFGAGRFQPQLEDALEQCDVVIVLITDAPSGTLARVDSDGGRFNMTSTETMKEYARLGRVDYCAVEIERAIVADKIIIPVYESKHGRSWMGEQMTHLKHLTIREGSTHPHIWK